MARRARATFTRALSPHPIDSQPLTLTLNGLVGGYAWPTDVSARGPAVLLLGGGEGGVANLLDQATIAGVGIPVLALAYFKAPGLPSALRQIPLEYFRTAIAWLGRQHQVDPKRVVVVGGSRGGEAALLVASSFPAMVAGVAAQVPPNVALCNFPGTCDTSAWTLHGRPIHYTRQFNETEPSDYPSPRRAPLSF